MTNEEPSNGKRRKRVPPRAKRWARIIGTVAGAIVLAQATVAAIVGGGKPLTGYIGALLDDGPSAKSRRLADLEASVQWGAGWRLPPVFLRASEEYDDAHRAGLRGCNGSPFSARPVHAA